MSKHLTLSHLQTILPPIKHLIDKKAEGVDWNENDPSAKGYIRNRPFYESIKNGTLFEGDFTFSEGPFAEIDYFEVIEGQEYVVTFNDVEYILIAKNFSEEGFECNYLGNASFGLGGNDTGEPFFIVLVLDGSSALMSTEQNVSITVKGKTRFFKKIDEKFLPKGIGAAGTGHRAEVFNQNSPEYASGEYSHAEGYQTTASGQGSHAEGWVTLASGECAHAEGRGTQATEYMSHAEGDNTTAKGHASHAEGYESEASGEKSHAEGNFTKATNLASHAEGSSTEASGQGSHAEGGSTEASEAYSHAEGMRTKATNIASHAQGWYTTASAIGSHAEGHSTLASSSYQHVQGTYNLEDSVQRYAHIVGNGDISVRSNAHTLDWSGNAWYQGDVFVGGTDQDSGERLAKMSDLAVSITTNEIDTICGVTV